MSLKQQNYANDIVLNCLFFIKILTNNNSHVTKKLSFPLFIYAFYIYWLFYIFVTP